MFIKSVNWSDNRNCQYGVEQCTTSYADALLRREIMPSMATVGKGKEAVPF